MKIGILNFQYAHNYGAVLISHALKHVLSGHECVIINFIPYKACQNFFCNSVFNDFCKSFFPMSPLCITKSNLRVLTSSLDSIIVGSDQVFRNNPRTGYLLDWAISNILCFSYGASFGINLGTR